MKRIIQLFAAPLTLSCFVLCVNAQAPVINTVTPGGNEVTSYGKLELTVNLSAGYANAYDYDDIAVQCIFTSPSSKKDTVDGFYMQDYMLDTASGRVSAVGSGAFKIRFVPIEAGTWQYQVICTNKEGSGRSGISSFTCKTSTSKGFIHKNTSNYLNFDDGRQYIPIGEDMGWAQKNIYKDYSKWLGNLSANGGNFIRVWMASWSFALEWQNDRNGYAGLKKYKQANAYYLDWLLDKCEQSGVYVMLCLNNHGQVSTGVNPEWKGNPYNRALGGPCANTWDFFTDTTAKADIKNRLRYIIARYGYARNIMSWELFNEVEWTDAFNKHKEDVTNWHKEMAAYIKSKDVYHHLVTTSYAMDYNDPATWKLADIDFTQTHTYANAPNIEKILAADNQDYLSTYNKPTLNAEFGLGGDASALAKTDPNGVYVHNCLWASSFSGGMGGAMGWWWDNYIEPLNLYYHYKTLATFTSALALKDDGYKKAPVTTTGGGEADITIMPKAGFGAPMADTFAITATGDASPSAGQLGRAVSSAQPNKTYHNTPTFMVKYPVAGQFKVDVSRTGNAARLVVYIDGKPSLDSSVTANTTYTVDVPAGTHSIKVDNPGTDGFNVSNYLFTNAGAPISTYVLRSAANNNLAGWVLNNKYNWQYIQNNGGKPPVAVTGAALTIPGMANGVYKITFFNCITGAYTKGKDIKVKDNTLIIALPAVAWDVAFTAVNKPTKR